MHRAAVAAFLLAGEALAHPGHGAPEGHLHGLSPELIALALLVAAWAALWAK